MRNERQSGFTLFEVAIALLIMALGVLTVIAMLPRSLEQLNLARQRLYAAAIAMDLSSHFTYGYVRNNKMRVDDYHAGRIAHSPDIERCANSFLGSPVDYRNMAPVPPEILLRLDSDDDLLRQLVRDGIPVFYPLPRQMEAVRPPTGQTPSPDGVPLNAGQVEETAFESQGAELGQIIFAVIGYPQLNATWHTPRNSLIRTQNASDYRGRTFPPFGGGGYEPTDGRPTPNRTETGFITVDQFPTGLSRGVGPRKGYFWEHAVRALDYSQPWAYNAIEDRGVPLLSRAPGAISATDSLYQPFAADERGRMLVFWSVNWKSYEDAEEAMPADCDISAFNCGNEYERHSVHGYYDGVGQPEISGLSNEKTGTTTKRFSILWRGGLQITGTNKADPAIMTAPAVVWRNPQSLFSWADVLCSIRSESLPGSRPYTPHIPISPVDPSRNLAAGEDMPPANWWFDRNFNRRYDVGPIPRGTRMRARTIARYVVYDPRLHLVTR